ncbi:MAG: multidrug effflux MFS transporter [Thiomonas sp.]|nr:multidrug effflux MFS transporter [Thiomonas sp.]
MTRSGALRRILTLGALTAFAPMSIDMYLPGFTALQHDLRATPDAVQRTLVVFFLGLALGQAFWGPVSDRFGRKRPLLLGIALYGVASVGCALAGSVDQLLLWRLLQALGGCAGIVIARSMVRDLYAPLDAARVFSRLTLVLGAAPILAPLAGAAIVQTLGWRAIFAVLAAFGLACFLAALALPESLPASARSSASQHPVRHALRIYGALLRDRGYIGFALSGALGQSAMFAYIAGAPFVFMQVFGLSPTQFGWLFGLNAMGLIAASQLNHALLSRAPSNVLLGWALRSLVVWAVVMLGVAALQIGGFWGVALPLFIALSSLGFSFPNATALALAHQTGRVGSAAALMGSMQFTLATLSGAAVGLFSMHSAAPMAAVFCLFACLALAAQRGLAPG